MTLDERDLRDGLKRIVGTWQVDFVVNAFSNDLAHIPAAEFKSDDGTDFSALTFTFNEDHTVVMEDTFHGKTEHGTWEQRDWAEYHYTLNAFPDLPEGAMRDNAETLHLQDGNLVFSIGFLAVGMKKIRDGQVTEVPDIGQREPGAEDAALNGIVGCYAVEKTMAAVGDRFDLFTRQEVLADLEKRKAAGEADEDTVRGSLQPFDMLVEFTPDHQVLSRMKLPDGVSEEEIKEAVEAGAISDVRDGYFCAQKTEWKALDGKYYYDTKEHREVFGEVQSSWDELTVDDEGLMDFGGGMMKLRRL